MTPDRDLARATAALLRAAPPQHRCALLRKMVSHFADELAILRPDLPLEEIERRVLRHRAAIDAELAAGGNDG